MIIYQIKNKINNKIYIGQTVLTAKARFGDHVRKAKRKQWLGALHEDINLYGKENFEYEILEVCSSQKEMDEREKYWIQEKNTLYPNGYNLEGGGKSNTYISKFTSKKMSEGRKKSNKIKRCKVYKYDKQYNLVSIFNSKEECKEKENIPLPVKNVMIKRNGYRSENGYYYLIEENNIKDLKQMIEKEHEKYIHYFDKNGNFIKEYPTTLAMEKETGKINVTISYILRKKQMKFEDGTFCLYKKDVNQNNIKERIDYILPKKEKAILMYNEHENKRFKNSIDAQNKTGLNRQLIARACKENKFYKNYYWKYCE